MKVSIDALHFLLLLETAVVLLGAAVFFAVRSGRHKRLYRKALKELDELKNTELDDDRLALREETAAAFGAGYAGDETIAETALPEVEAPASAELPAALPADGESSDQPEADASGGQVERLRRMVGLQKKTILDLMCYKDLFESAQQRLTHLQQSSADLQGMIQGLAAEGGPEAAPLTDSLTVLENTGKELSTFITVLEKENAALSEKFRIWESELDRINGDLEGGIETVGAGGAGGAGAGIDEGRYAELVAEREELALKLKEVSEHLQEKSTMLNDLQRQYEDLEKEYMVLYRQQQAAGGA